MATSSGMICLVVSLTRSSERRKSIAGALKGFDITFSFVDAIDAIDASAGFDSRIESDIHRIEKGTISNGEFACALSHRAAYDSFLASDCSHALILEDDAIPLPALRRFYHEEHFRTFPMQLLFHSRARVLKSRGIPALENTMAYPLAMSCTGAVAYSLNRDAAGELRRANAPVRSVADWPLDISALGAWVLEPMIVTHPVRTGEQSLLSSERDNNTRVFDPGRWLTAAYLRRKWLKLISTRIS